METTVGVDVLGETLAGQLETAISSVDFTVLYKPFIMLLPAALGIGCAFAGIKKGLGLIMSTIHSA